MVSSADSRPQALTITAAAQRLGVHRETVRAAIERGEIPAARIGRRWLVPIAALDRLLAGVSTHGQGGSS
jgi:excisionase family DNA binding protein